jgi:hypothetical protein
MQRPYMGLLLEQPVLQNAATGKMAAVLLPQNSKSTAASGETAVAFCSSY